MTWEKLGHIEVERLQAARLQLHWAAQVVAAAGETYLKHLPDTSHTAMRWLPDQGVLAGHLAAGSRPFRVALRPRDLTLLVLDEAGNVVDDRPLDGRSYDGALRWVRKCVAAISAGMVDTELRHPGYEMPDHPVARDARFDRSDAAAFETLELWFANAAVLLEGVVTANADSTPVLCWPHHFDIATLLALQTDDSGAVVRSIGVGLSPGDGTRPAPYLYVNGYPAPHDPHVDPLAAGEWNRDGWFGAVLGATEMVEPGDGAAQYERARGFVDDVVRVQRRLLGC